MSPSDVRGLGGAGIGVGVASGFAGDVSFPGPSAGRGEAGAFAGGFVSFSCTRGLAGGGAGADSGLGATGSFASTGTAMIEPANTNAARAIVLTCLSQVMPRKPAPSIDDDIIGRHNMTPSGYRK